MVSFDAGRNLGSSEPKVSPSRLLAGVEHPALLTAIGVDPLRPQRVAVTTAAQIFLSEDYGATWRQIPFNNGSVITAVALAPENEGQIMVGTSFAGFYETTECWP